MTRFDKWEMTKYYFTVRINIKVIVHLFVIYLSKLYSTVQAVEQNYSSNFMHELALQFGMKRAPWPIIHLVLNFLKSCPGAHLVCMCRSLVFSCSCEGLWCARKHVLSPRTCSHMLSASTCLFLWERPLVPLSRWRNWWTTPENII